MLVSRFRSMPGPRTAIVLALLCAFATASNWGKAFHIDDTAYLEMAQWIAAHPLRPMSGVVFWGDVPEPIHRINQPPLYPYLMAVVGSTFGWTEASMHALMAVFASAAVVLMHRLATLVVPDRALLATALTTASPAFVVGQNTMVDVPVLALWLLFFVTVLAPGWRNDRKRYVLAGLVCGAAILTKYTSLVLLPALALDVVVRRRKEAWYGIAVAAGIVFAWCAFNYLEYGGIHLLTRKADPGSWGLLDPGKWLLCLGAAAPATFAIAGARLWAARSLAARVAAGGLVLGTLLVAGAIVSSCLGALEAARANASLVAFFVASGLLLVILATTTVVRHAQRGESPVWMLAYWAVGTTAFILLLAPFVAMRHALLALPALVLLAICAARHRLTMGWTVAAVASVVVTTAAVAAADTWYAGLYREHAARVRAALPAGAKVWTVGHWGWQWYAGLQGMHMFVPGVSRVAVGDFLAYPERVHHQSLPRGVRLSRIEDAAARPLSCIECLAAPNAGFYATTSYAQLPWSVHRAPIESFLLRRVEAVEDGLQ